MTLVTLTAPASYCEPGLIILIQQPMEGRYSYTHILTQSLQQYKYTSVFVVFLYYVNTK